MKALDLFRIAIFVFIVALGTACNPFAGPAATPFLAPTPVLLPSLTPAEVSPTVPPTAPATIALPPASVTTTTVQPATGAQAPSARRISFQPGGTSAIVHGSLKTNGIDAFVLRASAGQTLSVQISSPQTSIIFSVNGANGDVLKSMGAGANSWSGVLPTTQDYYITINTPTSLPVDYTLQVTIPPLGTTPVPPTRQRISFQPGAASATVQGITATPGRDRFVLRALAGQTMTVNVTSAQANVILIIYGADGNVLISDHAGATNWTGQLPTTQDYNIDTRSVGDATVNFTLTVTIPPR